MRLFLALYPPDEVLDEVAEAVAALRTPGDGLRWSEREKWHLTLLFLGEIAEDRVARLDASFATELARHATLHLAVRGAGTFPGDATQARVLWAGVEGDVSPLSHLVTGVSKAARHAGVPVQYRAYVPHLTLARSTVPTDLSDLRTSLLQFASAFWKAGEVQLVHSIPGGRPRYRTVATRTLG